MYEKVLNQMKNLVKDTDLIIVTDREGKVMYYNNFDDTLNKFENQDAIGKSIFEMYPWLTKENSTIFKVLETGEPLVNHIQDIRLDENHAIYALNSAFPLINEHGIVGAIEISTDLRKEGRSKKLSKNKPRYSNFSAKYSFEDIITNNKKMLELVDVLRNVSKSNSNILIYGETGTGKEILAHAIHYESLRRHKPFVAQNCAAIPSSIMESLLFGSTKGSYTGAENKPGLFEIADGGTIYLDEINSMPPDLQSKLLRTIEDRTIRRVGDNRDICVDIRLITSTNENPTQMLEQKNLRMDLFFRLNVINVEIPPLRDRKDDIEVLLNHFISTYNGIFNKNVAAVEAKAKNILHQYRWPGNVREFKNCIESAFNLVDEGTIRVRHIPSYILSSLSMNVDNISINKKLPLMIEEYEKEVIEKVLVRNKYNVYKTAADLGIPRQTLYYKLNKHRLLAL